MKKYITFTNIIALFSFIVLMLFFTPCFTFTNKLGGSTPDHIISLFNATFGCFVPNPLETLDPIKILPAAGLILAFVFVIVGIILSVAKNRIKLLGFASSAFYIASGVLVACAVPMIRETNYSTLGWGMYNIGYYGWSIAIATLLCFAGFIAFIDVMVSLAKPKVQEVY